MDERTRLRSRRFIVVCLVASLLASMVGTTSAVADTDPAPNPGVAMDGGRLAVGADPREIDVSEAPYPDSPASGPPLVSYDTFYSGTVQRYAYFGDHVVVLVPERGLDEATMAFYVSSIDAAWEYYERVTGKPPIEWRSYDGRSPIAVVDETCGAGCGYVGWMGIEILDPYFRDGYREAVQGRMDQIPFYELGRNFFHRSIDERINYPPESMHSGIGTGFAVTNRFWAFDATGVEPGPFRGEPLRELRRTVDRLLVDYASDPSETWETTIAVNRGYPNPYGLGAESLVQGMFDQLQKWFGTYFVDNIWLEAQVQPIATSRVHAAENLVRAASAASSANLSDVFGERWKWPVSEGLATELEDEWGAPWQPGDPTPCSEPTPKQRHYYRVTVTNRSGVPLVTPVAVLHREQSTVWREYSPASPGLGEYAENGNPRELLDELDASVKVRTARAKPGVLPPGDSTSFVVFDNGTSTKVTVLAKLLCSNDGFVGANSRGLPSAAWERVWFGGKDLDAGTEQNTERFAQLPTACVSAAGGSGGSNRSTSVLATDDVVRPHPDLMGTGDLTADWQWTKPHVRVRVDWVRVGFTPDGVAAATSSAVGDWDGDGVDDLLVDGVGDTVDPVYLAAGDGTFGLAGVVDVAAGHRVVTTDMNDDGRSDAYLYAPGPGADRALVSNGDGTFTSTELTIDGDYRPIVVDDGIIWYAPGTAPDWYTEIGDDGTFTAATPLRIDGVYTPLVGDFDGDGAAEVLWYATGGAPDWYTEVGEGGRFTHAERRTVNGNYDPLVGDFDGNGHDDVFWVSVTGQDWVWSNGPTGVVTTGADAPVGHGGVGDFDGDGDDDIVWTGEEGVDVWFVPPGEYGALLDGSP